MNVDIVLGILTGTFIFVIGMTRIAAVIATSPRSCKNAAFKEYKARVEQNLKDEEQEFIEWLSEAAMAADRSAFEQFKASKK